MIISCSHCATSYEVEPSYFEPDGRKVKCSNCSIVWFQEYIRPEDVEDLKNNQSQSLTADEPGHEEDTDEPREEDIKSEAQRLVAAAEIIKSGRRQNKKQAVSVLAGWGTLAATIVLVAGLTVFYRYDIVKTLPGSAQLFANLGMAVNVRGMAFENVVYKRDFENGLPVLAIKGEVVNLTDEQKALPRVRFGLLDETDQELYYWTAKVDKKPIGPNARVKFVTRLASPPATAEGLIVRFARATSGYGAYR
tara:strand:+ start:36 stop:785 length:750 start_codon:yes stop_codon:yes gene_type:complete